MSSVNPEPILKLLHLTDVHWVDKWSDQYEPGLKLVNCLKLLKKNNISNNLADALLKRWRKGTAGTDIIAEERFKEFIKENFAQADIPCFLVNTGDNTTFGDDPSHAAFNAWLLDAISGSVIKPTNILQIHGNHDAWPGTFPAFAPRKSLKNMSMAVRFDATKCVLLKKPIRVEIYPLNTVVSDPLRNSFALGCVRVDELGEHKRTRDDAAFRIGMLHHPIAKDAYKKGTIGMTILGAGNTAHMIDFIGNYHMLMAGHTHRYLPLDVHPPLKRTKELATGALCQNQPNNFINLPDEELHQLSILNLFYDKSLNQVIVKTQWFIRKDNSGPYTLDQGKGTEQSFTLT